MRKWLISGLVGVVLIGAAVAAVMLQPRDTTQQQSAADVNNSNNTATSEKTPPTTDDTALSAGRYTAYSQQELAATGYDTTVLFFHAPWCIECRGFESAINEGTVPDGVQILKVDYDSSTDLRKQYGVTIQSTFVRVDGDGKKQTAWVGYGKDKTVDAIIQNTK